MSDGSSSRVDLDGGVVRERRAYNYMYHAASPRSGLGGGGGGASAASKTALAKAAIKRKILAKKIALAKSGAAAVKGSLALSKAGTDAMLGSGSSHQLVASETTREF